MKLVITRHPALVEYFLEIGLIRQGEYKLIAHATLDDVRGQHVIGVLPLALASQTASLTEIPLTLPAEMRGKELTIEDIRQFAGSPATYQIWKVA